MSDKPAPDYETIHIVCYRETGRPAFVSRSEEAARRYATGNPDADPVISTLLMATEPERP